MAASTAEPDALGWLLHATDSVIACSLPVFLLVGIAGNLFVVWLIQVVKSLKSRPPNIYLQFIAGWDAVFLLGLLPQRLTSLGLIDVNWCLCTVPLYMLNSAAMMSAWLITLLSVERCVVVTKRVPRMLNDAPSVQRSKTLALLLMPLPLLLNTAVFVTSKAGHVAVTIDDVSATTNDSASVRQQLADASHNLTSSHHHNLSVTPTMECFTDPTQVVLAEVMNLADFLLAFLLPFIIVNVSNVVVFCHLHRRQALRHLFPNAAATAHTTESVDTLTLDSELTATTAGHVKDSDLLRRHVHQKFRARQKQQLAGILVVVPTIFLTLNLPSYTMRIMHFLWLEPSALSILLHKLFTFLHYINFAINFVVYSFASRSFQTAAPAAIRHLLCRVPYESRFTDSDNGATVLHTYMQHRVSLVMNTLSQAQRANSSITAPTFDTAGSSNGTARPKYSSVQYTKCARVNRDNAHVSLERSDSRTETQQLLTTPQPAPRLRTGSRGLVKALNDL